MVAMKKKSQLQQKTGYYVCMFVCGFYRKYSLTIMFDVVGNYGNALWSKKH